MYQRYQEILKEIYRKNKEIGFYEEKALLGILASQWRYIICYSTPFFSYKIV